MSVQLFVQQLSCYRLNNPPNKLSNYIAMTHYIWWVRAYNYTICFQYIKKAYSTDLLHKYPLSLQYVNAASTRVLQKYHILEKTSSQSFISTCHIRVSY